MSYPYGTTVLRDRRLPVSDPYNPDRQTIPGWAEVAEDGIDTIALEGVYVAASSTTAVPDAMRTQSTDYRSLYSDDGSIDVKIGDRIRVGADLETQEGGDGYIVNQRPQGDRNPFTGWEPGVEIPLTSTIG